MSHTALENAILLVGWMDFDRHHYDMEMVHAGRTAWALWHMDACHQAETQSKATAIAACVLIGHI